MHERASHLSTLVISLTFWQSTHALFPTITFLNHLFLYLFIYKYFDLYLLSLSLSNMEFIHPLINSIFYYFFLFKFIGSSTNNLVLHECVWKEKKRSLTVCVYLLYLYLYIYIKEGGKGGHFRNKGRVFLENKKVIH